LRRATSRRLASSNSSGVGGASGPRSSSCSMLADYADRWPGRKPRRSILRHRKVWAIGCHRVRTFRDPFGAKFGESPLPRTRVNRPVERVRGCNRNRPLCVCGSTRPTEELHGRTAHDPAQRAGPDRLGSVSTETRPSSLASAKDHSFVVCTVLYLGTTLPQLRSWLSGCVEAAGPSTSAYLLKGRDPVGSGPTLISYSILRSFIQDAAMRTPENPLKAKFGEQPFHALG
jgi:hypothetical protein